MISLVASNSPKAGLRPKARLAAPKHRPMNIRSPCLSSLSTTNRANSIAEVLPISLAMLTVEAADTLRSKCSMMRGSSVPSIPADSAYPAMNTKAKAVAMVRRFFCISFMELKNSCPPFIWFFQILRLCPGPALCHHPWICRAPQEGPQNAHSPARQALSWW